MAKPKAPAQKQPAAPKAPATPSEQPKNDGAPTTADKPATNTKDDQAKDKPPAGPVVMLRVRCKHAGFWRAGRKWHADPVDVPASDFTEEQLAQLKAEPELLVEEFEATE